MRAGIPSASEISVVCGPPPWHHHDPHTEVVEDRDLLDQYPGSVGIAEYTTAGLHNEGLALVHADIGSALLSARMARVCSPRCMIILLPQTPFSIDKARPSARPIG